jgi:hypothetical protein
VTKLQPKKQNMKLNPATTTIIDDGQFRYPVATADLTAFEAAHGKITAASDEEIREALLK